ncbi:MAG: hypothetical protein O2973_01480 [Gemmatimonadetes bacterium]|nr:hypothetical protein [Gemmatimonadota bacterium]
MPRKHGPNRLGNYITVHEQWMAGLLDEGFVVDDRCAFTIQESIVLLSGSIVCLDAVTIEVEKEHDSAHDHRPQPHKHVYNTFGDGRESEVIDLEDEDAIPTLGEVIREVQDWHARNAGRLRRLK